eukprot:296924-Amphidinium_carterae.1
MIPKASSVNLPSVLARQKKLPEHTIDRSIDAHIDQARSLGVKHASQAPLMSWLVKDPEILHPPFLLQAFWMGRGLGPCVHSGPKSPARQRSAVDSLEAF